MTRMPIITGTSRALDWGCGLTITPKAASLRSAGDQPRVAARRAQPGVLVGDRPTGDLRQAMPSWTCPVSSEFPSFLPCRRRRTDLGTYALASLPSSDLVVGGATRAHPGLPQGERARAAGMIAATVPIHSRGGGARHRACIAWGGRGPACSRAATLQQSRVLLTAGHMRCCTIRDSPHPNRAIYSFFFCGLLHRGGLPGYSSPPAHGWGTFHQTQAAGRSQGRAGLGCCPCCPCCARPGGTCSGWAGGGRVLRDAGCGAEQEGIEAIFRAACGRVYSRSWTQRILGRYADD